jgi:hypothetical protein
VFKAETGPRLPTISGAQQSSSTDAWLEEVVDLSSYANDTIQIKFVAYRYQGFSNQVDISIDDFDIHEAPTCPKPTNFASTGVTSNSASFRLDNRWCCKLAT